MKASNVFYESKIAKTILFGSYHTIMLFCMIFTKKKEIINDNQIGNYDYLQPDDLQHELIHCIQYIECFFLGFGIISVSLILTAIFKEWNYSFLWFLLISFLWYYIMYGIEWLISLIHNFFSTKKKNIEVANDKAYAASAMEMEAYANEKVKGYLNNRKAYAFLKYYGKL